jgi:membrane-bound serine protease (ClpP class)
MRSSEGRRRAGLLFGTRPLLARPLFALIVALLGTVLLAMPAGAQADGAGTVLVARIDGPISPVIADHMADAVATAAMGGHAALLVEMDTPGGLDTSMRDIVQEFLIAPVPVIVYVSPPGARAASAGSVITLAAHVAAMAPGTNIGAATPIALEGGEVIDKVIEDAAAYVTAIAEARDRDVDFAVATVREGKSVAASEALEIGVIDVIADSRARLLVEVDGMTVQIEPDGQDVTLRTGGATSVEFDMSGIRRLLQALADPNLAFLFLSLGTLAILYELANPGGGIGGVLGAVMLVLAFFSLSVLPINIAGLLLLLLAAAMFVAELFVPGVGVFAAGGAIALIAAGLFLFQEPTGLGIDWSVLLPVPVIVAVGAVFVGRLVWRSQRTPAPTGLVGSIVGGVGEVRSAEGRRARVFAGGTLWKAHTEGPGLEVGQRVRIRRVDGIELVVDPEPPVPQEPQEPHEKAQGEGPRT